MNENPYASDMLIMMPLKVNNLPSSYLFMVLGIMKLKDEQKILDIHLIQVEMMYLMWV